VWMYNSRKATRQGGKLDFNWMGPYIVVSQTKKGLLSASHTSEQISTFRN
jgi:hypothetical protein